MFTIVTSVYDELTVSLAFVARGAQLEALSIGVVPLASDHNAFVPSRAGVAFTRSSVVVDTDWFTATLCVANRCGHVS